MKELLKPRLMMLSVTARGDRIHHLNLKVSYGPTSLPGPAMLADR